MATVRLSFSTRPYTGTNTVKPTLYKTSDLNVEIDSQHLAGPLGQTQWDFVGLERTNYKVMILEVDNANINTVISVLDWWTVIPENEEIKYLAPYTAQAGVTIGFAAVTSAFTFDGAANADMKFTGYDLEVERVGVRTLVKNVDYTWDPATSEFALLNGDQTNNGEYWIFRPVLQVTAGGGSVNLAGDVFKSLQVIADDYNIAANDFGTELLIKGVNPVVTLTLPDIFTVLPNRLLFLESGLGNHKQVIINVNAAVGNANSIDWLEGGRGTLYMGVCEELAIYREKIDSVVSVWRIKFPEGNYKTVGRTFSVYGEITAAQQRNVLELDGGGADGRANGVDSLENARLYNDHVLKQNPANLITFAAWATGNNKYKYSEKDAITGRFHIPDLRNMHERQSDGARLAGSYQADAVGPHTHPIPSAFNEGSTDKHKVSVYDTHTNNDVELDTSINSGTGTAAETTVKNVAVRRFVMT